MKQPTPKKPKQDLPGRLSRDFTEHKLKRIAPGGEGKKNYLARQRTVFAAPKK
jgi:hypothetical protein